MNRNVEIYRKIWAPYPDDTMTTTEEITKVQKNADITLYDSLKRDIKGFAVHFPKDFLCDESNMIKGPYFEIKALIVPHFISC